MSKNEHHIVPNKQGGWDIQRASSEKSFKHCETKQEAIDIGRKISQNQKTEFVIHNKDGKISQKDSHGNDSRKSEG